MNAPGEVFPYTYVRDFGGPSDQAVPDGAARRNWVMPRLSQHFRFVVGLGDDMMGYIFPKTNAVGVPLSLATPSDVDRFGCSHPDDGEAAARAAGDLIVASLISIVPENTSDDTIRTGRYVWRDGTLHRSPLGRGWPGVPGPGQHVRPSAGRRGGGSLDLAAGYHAVRAPRGERITVEADGVGAGWTYAVARRSIRAPRPVV